MQFEYFIGWDISKTKLDYSVGRGFKSILSGEVPNQVDAIIELFDKLLHLAYLDLLKLINHTYQSYCCIRPI